MPNLPRELWLAISGTLFLLGVAATAERILRARRHGYSVRLQIFVPLAATTLALSASFAAIIIDRMQARAALFARRAADDEAQVVAALLRRSLQAREGGLPGAAREVASSGVLQAFSRGVADTQVQILGASGETLISVGAVPEAGVLPPRVGHSVAEAEVLLEGGGRVRPAEVQNGFAELHGPRGLVLDVRSRRASCAASELTLSRTEFNLLQALLREPGRVFDRQALLDAVWGSEVVVGERTVDVHVKALRHKLDAAGPQAGAGAVIETVRGVGYRLKEG